MTEPRSCYDCGAKPGELHEPGCDVETCPRCGSQMISCGCVYEVNGLDQETLEEEHPDIYTGGPTDEMYAKFDAEWGARRIPWAGEPHGAASARKLGWWVKWSPGWKKCAANDPDACEDLNGLFTRAWWDAEAQEYRSNQEKPNGRQQ